MMQVDKNGNWYKFFTDEQKRQLWDVLLPNTESPLPGTFVQDGPNGEISEVKARTTEEEDVRAFVRELEAMCIFHLYIRESPPRREHGERLNKVLRTFESVLEQLQWLLSPIGWTNPTRSMQITEAKTKSTKIGVECFETAKSLRPMVERMITLLKESIKADRIVSGYSAKGGRPETDPTGFVRQVAFAYWSHIGERPTDYDSGPFVEIISIARNTMGEPEISDLRSVVRKALKKLPK